VREQNAKKQLSQVKSSRAGISDSMIECVTSALYNRSDNTYFGYPMIPDRPYTEILARLREFDTYLIGLQVTRHKLRSIITNIEEINGASVKGRDASLALEHESSEDHFPRTDLVAYRR
jgi:hypothetical protein